ncbi:MAG: hypothetical protein HYX40_10360 [Sphingobacteriales bacterium]|nr:hypothetical protein [Sphingobacteriales bacterium]
MKTLKVSLKAIVFILATGITLAGTPAKANGNNNITSTSIVNIAHAGIVNNDPVLLLSFHNANEEKVFITIADEKGIVVYTETFKGSVYAKKFAFETDLAAANPTITVTYATSRKTETYKVNTKESAVPSLTITKL